MKEFDLLRSTARPRITNPVDPSVDTFKQRFAPFSNDPTDALQVDPFPERIIRPGTRERFGDPTKVISSLPPTLNAPMRREPEARALGGPVTAGQPYVVGENGPEVVVPKQDGTVQTAASELPPGFRFADEPAPGGGLPPGFRFADEAPTPPTPLQPAPPAGASVAPLPAPNAGTTQFPSDDPAQAAREAAALRMQRAVAPEGGRQEGAATRAIDAVVPALGRQVQAGAEIAKKAVQTGDIAPGDAMQAALLANPASVAYRTGTAVAKAALTPLEAAQRETGVMALSKKPTAATIQLADEQLQKSALKAAQTPGQATPDEAGGIIKQALAAGGDKVSPRLSALGRSTRKPDENVIDVLIGMSKSGRTDDLAAIGQLRRFVPADKQGAVQSAIIERLGGRDGFTPDQWVNNYGAMPSRAKNILFGEKNPLRVHLDAIETISRNAPTWQSAESALSPARAAAIAGGIGLLAGPIAAPLAALGVYIPAKIIMRGLGKPSLAAPIAQWSRAYERVVRANGGPQSIAAFTLATRNLNNNLGTKVSADEILKGAQNGQPLE